MMNSTPIPDATEELRVSQFTYQRNLLNDGGLASYVITRFIASAGVPTGQIVGTICGMRQTHEGVDGEIAPGMAIPALNLPALTNPATGHDLSKITLGDMVLLVERFCQIDAAQKGLVPIPIPVSV